MWKKRALMVLSLVLLVLPMSVPPVAASPVALAATPAYCTLNGSVHMSPGPFAGNPTSPSSGSYTFNSTVLFCLGAVRGLADMTSSGSYSWAPPVLTLSGSFSTSSFSLGGGYCSGSLTLTTVNGTGEGSGGMDCSDGFHGQCTFLSGSDPLNGIIDPLLGISGMSMVCT